jgi:hypothetical protein
MKLPTEKTHPKTDLRDLNMLVYGPPKIGKSTFCSHAEGALFLATEAGLNHLDVFQSPISSWEQMLEALAEVARGEHAFRTIVIDTVDNAYRFCEEYVCRKLGIEHPSDAAYGKGFGSVNSEFTRVLTKLGSLPYGLILVSHAREREVTTRTGTIMRIGPTLPEGARKIVTGFADCILYFDVDAVPTPEGKTAYKRVIRTKPTTHYEAGDRTGRLPETLPLNYKTVVEALMGPKTQTETGGAEVAPPVSTTPQGERARKPRAPGVTTTVSKPGPGQKPGPVTPTTEPQAGTDAQPPAQAPAA